MAVIECNEINQTVNYLRNAFQDCRQIKAEDMQTLLDLIVAVNTCANGGPDYSTTVNYTYEPDENQTVTYEPNTFHSISLVVVTGTVVYDGISLSAGASINLELSNLNQQDFEFIVTAGSKAIVVQVIETI